MSNTIYLIDGSAYIFRAFYAVRSLSTKSGFPTNALYGFCQMLVKLLADTEPEYIAMVFDAGKLTFRNDIYPEYKANRDECPEELAQQMPYFREFSKAMGFPILELPGYEADDIIGTLSRRFASSDHEVVIVSGDKDLCQLVTDRISVWDTMRDRRYTRDSVKEKFGVYPEQMIDFLGLTGDSSDNIPGLKGVGPKTAVQLIEHYQDIDGVIENRESLRENKGIRSRKKIAETIELEEETLRLSRQLVTIDCHAPVTIHTGNTDVIESELDEKDLQEAIRLQDQDEDLLSELVNQFEFSSLFARLNGAKKKKEVQSARYQMVVKENFDTWLHKFREIDCFAFDLETTSLDPLAADVVGAAFCWDANEAWYLPFAHSEQRDQQVRFQDFIEACGDRLSDPSVKKIGQNIKYDVQVLSAQEIAVDGVASDTMIAAYLLDPDKSSFSLDALAEEFLGVAPVSYKEVIGDKGDFSEVSLQKATSYAAEDAHLTWLLHEQLYPQLQKESLDTVYQDIELPLLMVLERMERAGICLDTELLNVMSEELAVRLERVQGEIFEDAGCEFNMNSPKQLSDVLFNQMGISTRGLKKTKTGISTDASVLEKLSLQGHELPAKILEYRGLHKLKSTYVDALPKQVSSVSGRLHTRFNQTGTATGRLSSSDPNLQNIPIQHEEGRKVRAAFVAAPGMKLISADYSQIELRLLAHLSEDPMLIEAFTNGEDVHARTAREIVGISEEDEVDAESRRIGKTINFGIVYGMSGFRLARDLGIPVGMGNQYIEQYFERYAGVRTYFKSLEQQADEQQWVATLFGRKRFLSGIESRGRDAGFRRRAAMNAPIQGSAADIVKKAMITIQKRIDEEGLPMTMLLQIHDELVFECQEDYVSDACLFIQECMEHVVELIVPLHVDIGSGKNWYEAH